MSHGVQVVIDAHDPAAQAEFWALALDYVVQPPPPGFADWAAFGRHIGVPEDQFDRLSAVVDPAGVGPRVLFQKVPEAKEIKNRVHLDVSPVDLSVTGDERAAAVRAHADRLVGAGARFLRELDEPAGRCLILADPEDNEFCVH